MTSAGPALARQNPRSIAVRYGLAVAAVVVAYLVRLAVDPILGDRSSLELFLVAVAFSAWFGGFGPALVATVLSVAVGTWSFVPPRQILWISYTADRVEAGAFLFAAMSIALLVRSLRRAQRHAEHHAFLAQDKQVELSREIQQRTEAQATLKLLADENDRQRQDLQAVLDAAPVGIWVAHDRECRQVTGNRLAHALFGDWEGNSAVRVRRKGVDLAPEDRPLHRAATAELPELATEFELVSPDDRSVWVLSNAVPLLDDHGKARGAVSIWADVTGLKRAEAAIRDLNAGLESRVQERTEELRRALDELSSYAYSIAHDLRAPLRSTAGFAQLLVEESGDALPASCADHAGRIVAAAKRMDEMILDLLQYSRISREAYPVQEVDAYQVATEAVEHLAAGLHRPSGEISIEGPIRPVAGHRALVREVFDQLLSNAIKFAKPGIAPQVRIRSEISGRNVRIWIEDNGIGIPAEYKERIFGVFQRLQLQDGIPGSGMGLAIVRRAVDRMEGRCGLESEPGVGSRFWIELPDARRASDAGLPATPARPFLRY